MVRLYRTGSRQAKWLWLLFPKQKCLAPTGAKALHLIRAAIKTTAQPPGGRYVLLAALSRTRHKHP